MINAKIKTEKCINNNNVSVIKSLKRESDNMKTKVQIGASGQKDLWTRYERITKKYNKILSTIEMNENLNPFSGR